MSSSGASSSYRMPFLSCTLFLDSASVSTLSRPPYRNSLDSLILLSASPISTPDCSVICGQLISAGWRVKGVMDALFAVCAWRWRRRACCESWKHLTWGLLAEGGAYVYARPQLSGCRTTCTVMRAMDPGMGSTPPSASWSFWIECLWIGSDLLVLPGHRLLRAAFSISLTRFSPLLATGAGGGETMGVARTGARACSTSRVEPVPNFDPRAHSQPSLGGNEGMEKLLNDKKCQSFTTTFPPDFLVRSFKGP